MTEMIRKRPLKAAVLFSLFLLPLLLIFNGKGEQAMTIRDTDIRLKISWKKEDEFNPLYTQRFGADPGVMEYNGRLYVYTTNDLVEKDADGNVLENSYRLIRTINCISSDDLVNWTDHGAIPVAGGIAKWAVNSWAPCAAHKVVDGAEKFFLYFCNGGNGIGVLTADSPVGPWRDELGRLLIDRSVPTCADVTWLFDPAVMVDEDGTGYLAFGGGVPQGRDADPGTGRIVRLGADMISLDGDPVRLEVPYLFEDSGINRIGNRYIYSYCSNWNTRGNSLGITDGAIEYMTADSPLGPYTYAGELFPNQGRFFGLYGNNHHAIACLDGQYYLFYHNRSVEKARGLTGNYRSPQIDRITVGEDGALARVRGTMRGVEQLKPLNPYETVSALTMSHQAGTYFDTLEDRPVLHALAGGWIRVTSVDFSAGCRAFTLRACSPEGCTVYVVTGDVHGEIAAAVSVPAGDAPAAYTVPLNLAGVQDVFLVFSDKCLAESWSVD